MSWPPYIRTEHHEPLAGSSELEEFQMVLDAAHDLLLACQTDQEADRLLREADETEGPLGQRHSLYGLAECKRTEARKLRDAAISKATGEL